MIHATIDIPSWVAWLLAVWLVLDATNIALDMRLRYYQRKLAKMKVEDQ